MTGVPLALVAPLAGLATLAQQLQANHLTLCMCQRHRARDVSGSLSDKLLRLCEKRAIVDLSALQFNHHSDSLLVNVLHHVDQWSLQVV